MKTHTEVDSTATYQEIISQPEAWQGALDAVSDQADGLKSLWANANFSRVIFTGCGSTYYLSLAAAALWQSMLDTPARGIPGGELFLYPQAYYSQSDEGKTLLVAISRSGTTSETVAITRQFKADTRGKVIVITNYDDSPLAALGDVTIPIPEGQEKSVAQTRSFASMYVAVTAMIVKLAERDDLFSNMANLPECGTKLIEGYETLAREIGENLNLDRFYFLGGGPRYGLACEVNLKMKEMTLTHSEPFHFFEFRHGPMSMVNENTAVIGLLSEENQEHEDTVLQEMAKLGGKILSLAEKNANVNLSSQLPTLIRNVLYLPILQLMACYRSVAKGLNPDSPHNLTAVVELDLES